MNKIFLFLFTLGLIYFARFDEFTFIFQKIIVPVTFLFLLFLNKNIVTKIGILSLYILFLLLASASFVHTINIERTFRFFQIMVGAFMLLSIYTLVLMRNPRLLSAISYGLIFSGLFLILSTGNNQFANEEGGRNLGITSNPNLFGMYMLYAIFGISLLWREASNHMKIFLASMVIIFLYGIISSASRKSLISAGVFISLWVAFLIVEKKNILKTTFLVLIIFILLYFVFNVFYLDSKMMFRMQYVQESGEGRYDIATEGIKLFSSSPLIGVGLGTFQEYSDSGKYAHNDFFELIATLGLAGLIIYISIYYWLIRRIKMVKKISKNVDEIYRLNIFLAIIVTMIVLGLGRPQFFDIFSMSIFGIIAGYTIGIGLKINEIDED